MRPTYRPSPAPRPRPRRTALPKKGSAKRTFIFLGALALLVLGARLILPTLSTVILSQSAKGPWDRAVIKSLETAVTKYQVEYSQPLRLPEWTTEIIPVPSSGRLLEILMGRDTQVNPRGIRFFEPVSARAGRNGLVKDAEDQLKLLDTEGRPYLLQFDLDGDGFIPNPDPAAPDSQKRLPGPVLIFTAGPDRDARTWKDNVRNW